LPAEAEKEADEAGLGGCCVDCVCCGIEVDGEDPGIAKLGALPAVFTPVTLVLLPGAVSAVGVPAPVPPLEVMLEILAG
jgi:hypothetical protein